MVQQSRVEIPADIAAQVLFQSDRTCCVCRERRRPVQIHHIDGNPANSVADNLAVLCLECHRDTQVRGGFDRKLDAAQIVLYRDDWLNRIGTARDKVHDKDSRGRNPIEGARALRYLKVTEKNEEHSYSFAADYPQVHTEDSVADLATNSDISTFVTRALQRFRAEAIAGSAAKGEMKREGCATAWDDMSISFNISMFTSELLSVEFQGSSYRAAAVHPNTVTRTLNFRFHPSLQLELANLFEESSDYLGLLSQYCIRDLHRQQSLRGHDSERAEQPNGWILSGAAPDYANYEQFVLAKGGIRVFFDPYQVGSYSEGRYEVFVPGFVLAAALDGSMKALLD